MKLNMLVSMSGSPDGVSSLRFEKGEREVPDSLAAVFLAEGWAEHPKKAPVEPPVDAPAALPEPEAAPLPPVPERAPKDKAAKAPQRRKQGGKKA